jgi:hypothetical protein
VTETEKANKHEDGFDCLRAKFLDFFYLRVGNEWELGTENLRTSQRKEKGLTGQANLKSKIVFLRVYILNKGRDHLTIVFVRILSRDPSL